MDLDKNYQEIFTIDEKIKIIKKAGRYVRFIMSIAIITVIMIMFAVVLVRHTIGIFLTIALIMFCIIPLWLLIKGFIDVKYDVKKKILKVKSKTI